jgi:hypothetical protein
VARYNEIKASYPTMEKLFGPYAAGEQKLDEFIKRYHQIKDSYPGLDLIYPEFAGSTKVMDQGAGK